MIDGVIFLVNFQTLVSQAVDSAVPEQGWAGRHGGRHMLQTLQEHPTFYTDKLKLGSAVLREGILHYWGVHDGPISRVQGCLTLFEEILWHGQHSARKGESLWCVSKYVLLLASSIRFWVPGCWIVMKNQLDRMKVVTLLICLQRAWVGFKWT